MDLLEVFKGFNWLRKMTLIFLVLLVDKSDVIISSIFTTREKRLQVVPVETLGLIQGVIDRVETDQGSRNVSVVKSVLLGETGVTFGSNLLVLKREELDQSLGNNLGPNLVRGSDWEEWLVSENVHREIVVNIDLVVVVQVEQFDSVLAVLSFDRNSFKLRVDFLEDFLVSFGIFDLQLGQVD